MSEEKTYQPHWGEKKHHHHHHRSDSPSNYNGPGGRLKMRDRQAYYGLMLVVVAVLGFGVYKLVKMFYDEIKAMPMDDPTTEMNVDELRIHKADEQDALLYSDGLAQATHLRIPSAAQREHLVHHQARVESHLEGVQGDALGTQARQEAERGKSRIQ